MCRAQVLASRVHGSQPGRGPADRKDQGEARKCVSVPDDADLFAEAFEHCEAGVKLAHEREKPYLLLRRLHRVMGTTHAAKTRFTRAVQIRPKCVEAMRELRISNKRVDGKGRAEPGCSDAEGSRGLKALVG